MATSTFGCDACGKQYKLKPEHAGRKVQCTCGAVLVAPELEREEAGYDLKDEPAPKAAPPVAPLADAPAQTTPAPLTYQRRGLKNEQRDPAESVIHDQKRDLLIPLSLIGVSAVTLIAFLLFRGEITVEDASLGALGLGIYTLAKTVLLVGSAFIVAPLLGVSFGPVWTAILKLAAIGLAPEVLSTIITQGLGFPGAGMLAWSISVLFYWFLISYLFQMDASDAWLVVMLFAVFKFLAGIGVMLVLVSLAI